MWRLGGLLALLAATTNAQDVPRPTRLRIYEVRTALSRGFGGGTLPNLSAASRRQASGLDAAIARGQHAAMGDVSDLTEDDGTSSPTILHQADAIRFLERARARR